MSGGSSSDDEETSKTQTSEHVGKLKLDKRCQQSHPDTQLNFLSRHLVTWLWPVLRDGQSRPLQSEDIWPLPEKMTTHQLATQFSSAFAHASGSLKWTLLRLARKRLCILGFAHYYLVAIMFSVPVLIQWNARYFNDSSASIGTGLLISIVSFVLTVMGSAGPAFVHRNAISKGCELRLMSMYAVFCKALQFNFSSWPEGSMSRCITTMSVDCERIYWLQHMGSWVHFQLVLFSLTIVIIAFYAGMIPGIVGAVVLMFLCFLTALVAKRIMAYRRRMQTQATRRLLLTRQALDGIRNIKLYGWVEPVEQRISASRLLEIAELSRYLFLRACSTTLSFIAPTALTFSILAVAAAVGQDLSIENTFAVLALANSLRGPMSGLPVVVGFFTDGLVSVRRTEQVLQLPEATDSTVGTVGPVGDRSVDGSATLGSGRLILEIENLSCAWGTSQSSEAEQQVDASQGLTDISLTLKLGELCCVVGPVGGGKTSLVSAILGNMASKKGSRKIHTNRGIAYCPQQPWIFSSALWQNIAVNCDEYNQVQMDAYLRAVDCAELLQDIAELPGGHHAELGAHGINLSGGQRARIGLARALYQCEVVGCELVVLDDVLSAVDLPIARRLIERCICGGIFDSRTVILVVNSHYEVLVKASCIVVMSQGKASIFQSPRAYLSSSWAELLVQAKRRQSQSIGDNNLMEQKDTSEPSAHIPEWISRGLPSNFGLNSSNDESCNLQLAEHAKDDKEEADRARGRLLIPEDRQVGILSWGTYRLYFGQGACGCGSTLLVLVLILIFVTEVLRIVTDLWLAEWMASDSKENIDYWVGNYALLSAGTFVLCFFRSSVFMIFARRSSVGLHQKMLSKALRASTNLYFDTVPTSQILNRLSKDLDVVDTMLPHFLLEFFQDFIFLFCTLVVVAWKAPFLLAAVPFCAYAFVKIRGYYMGASRELKRIEAISRTPLLALLSEAMEGITTIRALGLESSFERRFRKLADMNGTLFWHGLVLLPWLITRIDLLGSVCVLATSLSLVFLKTGTAVDAVLAFTFILNFSSKMQWAVRQSIEAENFLTSVERCEHFERIPLEHEPERSVTPPTQDSRQHRAAVEFVSVSVRYRPGLPLALTDVSFCVRHGERVGIIGRSGCGKSTLILCLFRLLEVETGGQVLFQGVNVQRMQTTELRRSIAAIPQVPLIYAGTLRENLDPMCELHDDQIWEALADVELADFIKENSQGLDTSIAEDGGNLSSGQRQLLSIARALLRRAAVVVCDEATSSCDPLTDTFVQQVLQGSKPRPNGCVPFEGAAMLTIAHRLDTLATYDRVLMLSSAKKMQRTGVLEIVRPVNQAEVDAIGSPGFSTQEASLVSL